MGRTRYQSGEAPFPHFLTCTVVGWLPVFTRTETLQMVLDAWQLLQDQDRLVLFGYVVLENHIYFIGCRHNRLVIQRSETTRSVKTAFPR
jgi:putative transposase